MTASGARHAKAALSRGCESHPAKCSGREQPGNSGKCPEAADGVARESEGGAGFRFHAWYDKISRDDILAHAWAHAWTHYRSNKGAPDVVDADLADKLAHGGAGGSELAYRLERLGQRDCAPVTFACGANPAESIGSGSTRTRALGASSWAAAVFRGLRSFIDAPAPGLDLPAPYLAVYATTLGTPGRSRRRTCPGDGRCAFDEFLQARDGVVAIPILTAVALRLDDNDAIGADSLIAAREQACLDRGGQAGCPDVEPQMQRRRYLVDILSAGALRANRRPLDVSGVDDDGHREDGSRKTAVRRSS